MLENYFKGSDLKNESNNMEEEHNDNEDNEDDNCVNEKYFMKEDMKQVKALSGSFLRKDVPERLTSIHQLDTLKNSNRENENSIENYIQMEQAYLKDGRCPSNPTDERKPTTSNCFNNEEAANEEIEDDDEENVEEAEDGEEIEEEAYTKSNKPSNANEEDDISAVNEVRARPQEGLHCKYEAKLLQKENKPQSQTRTQMLSHEPPQFKADSESNLNVEWNEKYDQMVADCKEKLRSEKEARLTRKMQDTLRPQIEMEIYKKEYNSIVAKLREEIEDQIAKEIEEKKKEEIAHMKRKMDCLAKVKTEEIEKVVQQKCKEEMEKELQREASIKESEYKLKYMQKYELYKSTLEKKLAKEYEEKKKEVKKEIDEIKAKLYRSKCSEKLKVNKINRIQKNICDYQKKNMKNSQQVERIINTKDVDEEIERVQLPQYDGNNDREEEEQYCNDNEDEKVNPNQFGSAYSNSVNLFEINNQLKRNISKGNIESKARGLIVTKTQSLNRKSQEANDSNKPIIPQRGISPTQAINPHTANTPNLMPTISLSPTNTPISPEKENEAISPIKAVSKPSYANKQDRPIIHQGFNSIQLDPSIPDTFADFGKYLIAHIEKEENYRLLFMSELKKMKGQIKKIFDAEKRNDHCLTDYMLELWSKLEISYAMRYSIMKSVTKMSTSEAYAFLDTETEHLTNYFQESEDIFKKIKARESLKVKLQAKLNRNELMTEDQLLLDDLTAYLHDSIKEFKANHPSIDIIWKGLRYECFMNYEKWFYEIRQGN